MRVLFLVMLFALGACFGSFLCCQARRLHLRDRAGRHPHRTGKKKKQPSLGNRSVCLNCGRRVKWFDNIPILSWLVLRGKCRYCHHKIGRLELASELGLALAFLLLGINFDITTTDPLAWSTFLLSFIFVCLIGFLAIYDAAYSELPTKILFLSIACAVAMAILELWSETLVYGWTPELLLGPLGAVALLAGTYLALYLVSKGNWVGDGDWLLGFALGAALANPWLALLTLCLANLLACVVTLPKYQKHLKIPLGPFLISAFVIIFSFQDFFVNLL